MAVKIRLQRHGKKGQPFYHIVIADARAARDGKFIEKIGTYNPLTSPATINLDVESACKWLKNGAQPTDTVRSLLSYKGVMLKRHLQIGVEKGAITQETADAKFNAWLQEKEGKIAAQADKSRSAKNDANKAAMEKEEEIKKARLAAIEKKRAEAEKANAPQEEVASEEEQPVEVSETPSEEAPQVEEAVAETNE
ncbi:MAG: 30S ribosomal protein S16 [Bacteroidales bacterium]|jgi:small subunit ribosomal protein S16|nr:30S ribosomal protein S16 [Bacteroidales bacterium]